MMAELTYNQPESHRRSRLLLALLASAIIVAYAPMLVVFFQQQWSQPQSQFFPFVIGAFAGLFWLRWKEGHDVSVEDNAPTPRVAKILATIAWAILAMAIAVYNPWLSAASLNILLAAIGVIVSRRRAVTYLWGIWAMLWLMLPLPLGWDQELISKLQLVSSKLSSFLLDAFGVEHLMSGNMLFLPDKQLFVDEACSGIISVMSIVACGVIYGVWRNRPPFHIVGLAACGVFWAMMMNVLRITIIALLYDWFRLDWTKGAPHELLSLAIFLLTFAALLSTDLVLLVLLAPIEKKWKARAAKEIHYGRRLARWWDRLVEWGNPLSKHAPSTEPNYERPMMRGTAFTAAMFTAFGLLAAGQLGLLAWEYAHPVQGAEGVAKAKRLSRDSLPATLAGAQRAEFKAEQREREDIFGEYSRTFIFRGGDSNQYHVSCDFPFSQGWHELTVCYRGAGWKVAKRTTSQPKDTAGSGPWTMVEAELERSDGDRGYVAWAMFDENGEPVSPPLGAVRDQLWRLFVRRSPLIPTRQMFQVQVFVQAPGYISDELRSNARKLLMEAREQFRREIMSRKNS